MRVDPIRSLLRAPIALGFAAAVGALSAGCSVPTIEYEGKTCTVAEGCPGGLVCDRLKLTCVAPNDGGTVTPPGGGDAGLPSDGGNVPPPPTVDSFCAQYGDAVAATAARCFGGPLAFWQKILTPMNEKRCNQMRQAVATDSATFSEAIAQNATRDLMQVSCREFEEMVRRETLSRLVVPGNGLQSDACGSDFECQPSMRCEGLPTCPGSCQPLAAMGANCVNDDQCVTGAVCGPQGVCERLPLDGEACPSGRCQAGLYCDASTGPAYCRALGEPGQPCQSDGQCVQSNYCDLQGGTPNPTCQPRSRLDQPCANGYCEMLTSCVDGTCRGWPVLGQPCGRIAGGYTACLEGGCDVSLAAGYGTCVAFLNPGDACNAGTMTTCNPATSYCDGQRCQPACYMP